MVIKILISLCPVFFTTHLIVIIVKLTKFNSGHLIDTNSSLAKRILFYREYDDELYV